jgi:hypothetical protein
MATRHRKHLRKHSRKHSRKNNRFKRTFKRGFHVVKSTIPLNGSIPKKGFKKGFNTMKYTSKKYMPRVKTGIEDVGSKVTKTATKSVPVLQKTSRDLFGLFGIKKSKRL